MQLSQSQRYYSQLNIWKYSAGIIMVWMYTIHEIKNSQVGGQIRIVQIDLLERKTQFDNKKHRESMKSKSDAFLAAYLHLIVNWRFC